MSSVRLQEKSAIRFVIWTLCIVYFTSYFSRLGYATVIAEIVASEGIAKSDAALATTACFITYGSGQLISGWLGDRISPKKLIFAGLLTTTACNILLPLCGTTGAMTAVWGVNGFAQALLWPPMMRLMTAYFDQKTTSDCCVKASVAANTATILLYLTSPLMIRLGSALFPSCFQPQFPEHKKDRKALYLLAFRHFLKAGDERIELPPKVLETPIIPFDQSPVFYKNNVSNTSSLS